MKIYELAVKRPISTILLFVAVILMGLFAYTRLAVDIYPRIENNQLMIVTAYEGASSNDVESNVTEPLENVLNAIEGLKKISSKSRDNTSVITLEFQFGVDLDEKANNIRDQIEFAKSYLPEGANNPVIFKFSTDMIPIMFYSVSAKESINGLHKILEEQVANPLKRIDGVGTVMVSGAPSREIQVNVIPERLEAYHLTVEQIAAVIQNENVNVPAGTMNVGTQNYSLRLDGEIKESEELKNLIVSALGGQPVYLSDVATVKDTTQSNVQEAFINSVQGAWLVIQKQSGANTVEIAEKIRQRMPEIQKNLPSDINLNIILDTSEWIEGSVNSLVQTILLALVIVSLVVLFFLGRWRATFIIVITIPISLIASFFYLMISGNTLNLVSLSALSIAIGMVVDDAIVVLENITTHLERGSAPKQAAIHATNEVSLAVIASTLTILAVFLPMTLITGLAGVLFGQLGWMITVIITVSTISALSLTPMLASKMMQKKRSSNARFDKIYAVIKKGLKQLDHFYVSTLRWCVSHRTITTIASFGFLMVTIVVSAIFIKTEFFPASDNNIIELQVSMPSGTRMEITREKGLEITEKIKEKYPEIDQIAFTVGSASKATWSAMDENGDNFIGYYINCGKPDKRPYDIFEIADGIRMILANIPELDKYKVMPGGNQGGGFSSGSNIDVEIYGYDLKETDKVAQDVQAKLSEIQGLRDVKISRSDFRQEYDVKFDRQKLALNNLDVATVSTFIKNRINGTSVSLFREKGNEYEIRVRYAEEYRASLDDIENILVYTAQGNAVRVRDVATIELTSSLPVIERQNRQRIVTVSGSLYNRALSEVVKDVHRELENITHPNDIDIELAGSYKEQQEAFGDLFLLLIICVILVYIVMASQFESLTYPFIIMISLPFSFTGSILILSLFGQPLNIMGMIGGIMLIGIVVKNGIILIEYININRARGRSILYAVIEAGKSRLRPVLMTASTTALGMLPMALGLGQGSEFWKTMGLSVIGGLILSTAITLIIVPTLYAIFAGNGVKRKHRRYKKQYPEYAGERI